MNPRLVEELARQRHAEQIAQASRLRPAHQDKRQGQTLRRNTGWAIVAIGLRIAESGGRG